MTAAAPQNRWLHGRVPDLVLGCGLLYVLSFAIFLVAGDAVRGAQPEIVFPLLVLFFSAPHYGATLQRVYERREDRQRYVVFSLWATLAIGAWFLAGVYSALAAAWMVTLYLTWSPWHYTGQNYGIALMFLRRRGVPVEPGTKRWIYASFLLSFLLTALVMHSTSGATDYVLTPEVAGQVRFINLGIPWSVGSILVPATLLGYVASLVVWSVRLLRRAHLADVAPALVLALTQALWFSAPFAFQHWNLKTGIEPLDWSFRVYYFGWIALGHALQYLWITSYYARASAHWPGYVGYYLRSLLYGKAMFVVPVLLLAPSFLGGHAYDLGLALLVTATVNLHHFVLDGAIWKLRSGPIANVLIRSVPEPSAGIGPQTGSRWPRRLVLAGCTAALGVGFYVLWQERVAVPAALSRSEPEALDASLDRLDFLGYDYTATRILLAQHLLEKGRIPEALEQFQKNVESSPRAEVYLAIARLHESQGQFGPALEAYRQGLALNPQLVELLQGMGELWLRTRRPGRALPFFQRVLELAPGHEGARAGLARARTAVEQREAAGDEG